MAQSSCSCSGLIVVDFVDPGAIERRSRRNQPVCQDQLGGIDIAANGYADADIGRINDCDDIAVNSCPSRIAAKSFLAS